MQSFFIFKEDRMIKLNHNLSLDLYYNEEKTIDTKEYDKNSRYITVSLTYKGKEYQISGDTVKARIKWLKPDKKPVFNDCVINSDNTITIDLTEQMLIVSGVAKATLSLYDINTDQVLSTTSFNAVVEASAVSDDTILSSDEYNSLHNEFKRLNNKVKELDKTVTEHENIREKNEDSRKSNEIKRETNESERINSENARMNNENTRIDSENERVKNENTRIANENVRQHNEATRETQEDKRESDTAIAIEKANEAAKNANDKANDLQTKLDNHHFVLTDELENTISSDSTTTAPTANAVKIVNDKLDSHTNNHDNPHNLTKEQIGLGNNDNTADMDKPVSTAQQKAIDDAYANSNKYTDKKIADLIGGAPETLDTLKEVADAISASKSTEEALNSAIGTKANQAELDTHTGNDTIHITSDERENWNDANDKKHTHSNKSVLDGITSALITAWNNAVEHITDTVKHITSSERTKWNAAYDKANNALPKTGGTLTGSLDIYGNASQNPLRTRGIVGSDGQGSDGDLYLQYGSAGNIYLGKNGSGYIDNDGKSYNGTAMSSRYPVGFSSYTPADITWGVQTGTPLVAWNTSNGGSIGFRDNCPADGQVSMVIDGRVYQDEGRYPVLDSNNYTSVITKQGICDILGYTPSTGSDSFEIGGTNLFQGTKEFEITNAKGFSNTVSSVTSETYNGLKIRKNLTAWNFYRPILSLEPGNYVFSGHVKGVNGLSTYIQVSAGDILNAYTFSITSDWKRYSITFEITEKSDVTFFLESREAGEIYECGWKLEKGNKATDWSPAPEDLESALSIRDYNDTSKKIKVGWVGSALNEDQILAVACYASGDDDTVKAKIKDVTKDTFVNWLGTVPAANNAAHLGRNGNAGYPMTFNWAGKTGQPSWLWGGENGEDMYVYNPSNFNVSHAESADSVSWAGVKDTPSTYPPSNHNHGTADSNFTCFLTDNTDAGFAALHDNGTTTGFFLKTIRGQYTAPGWFEGDYASGIAFGGADTHAVISCKYNYPRVTFAGGNGTEPNWWMRIAGTSGHSYKLDDFITTSGTTALSGSIVPNEDVGMELGDETHRFTNIYSSNITTGAIYMEHDSNAIYESGNDAANGNGGGLNNLVVRSWWGVSFTSNCAGGRYGGKDQTAVGIDCREGVVRAYNFEGLLNGHSVNADVPSNAVFTDTKGSVASNNGVSSGYAMLTLASGYKILAFHTAARNYAMTNTYGNMYWASFEIPIPVTGIKYFTSVNVTPFATSGLISVSITNYTVSKIQGFVFSPLAETKSISFHVTLHGTAS